MEENNTHYANTTELNKSNIFQMLTMNINTQSLCNIVGNMSNSIELKQKDINLLTTFLLFNEINTFLKKVVKSSNTYIQLQK